MQQQRYYEIISKSAGRVLDISQDATNKGQLIIYDSWGGPNQQFSILHKNLYVCFVNKGSGLYLTVANDSDKNGAVLVEQPFANKKSQLFRLQEIYPSLGEFVVFTFCGKALDICEDSWKNGTRIIQWDFHGKDNQKWKLRAL